MVCAGCVSGVLVLTVVVVGDGSSVVVGAVSSVVFSVVSSDLLGGGASAIKAAGLTQSELKVGSGSCCAMGGLG